MISTIVIVTSSLSPCHCHFLFVFFFFLFFFPVFSFNFFKRKFGREVCVIRVGGEGLGQRKPDSTMTLTGGPFCDGPNRWQLTTFEGFSQKHFSCFFFSPSFVEVLSQCATCINKNGKK